MYYNYIHENINKNIWFFFVLEKLTVMYIYRHQIDLPLDSVLNDFGGGIAGNK